MPRKIAAGWPLRDGYDGTIERIKAEGYEKSQTGNIVSWWITCSEWPLWANQLCHTITVKLGFPDFEIGNILSMFALICSDGQDHARGENLAHAQALIELDYIKYLGSSMIVSITTRKLLLMACYGG